MIDRLFATAALSNPSLEGFLDVHHAAHGAEAPADRALLGGALADRLGFAFVAGYHAALAALVPNPGNRPALCITEQGRPHPGTIATTLRDGALEGHKGYVTAGSLADRLWVLASTGREGDRNVLALVEVAADAPGVTVTEQPPLAMVPEVPHATVTFSLTPITERVLGDAWRAYAVPFRTREDTFVLLAATAYRIAAARRAGASDAVVEDLLAVALGLHGVAQQSPTSPATHRTLAGLDRAARTTFASAPLPDDEAERWTRDEGILQIADRARTARTDKARELTR